jgi:pimeloyl-ACP methyl ester carboxylesterase
MSAADGGQAITLRDGRRLGYAEYGNSAGKPLFFFHGFPNSRLLARLFTQAAVRRGVRIIALDRPGFGLSDFKRGRTLAGWPDDVVEAADALGIDRFAVLGYSGGGPYAAACAARIPERLTAVAIVSGLAPLCEGAAVRGFPLPTRLGISVLRRLPWLSRPSLWLMGWSARRNPERAVRTFERSLPLVDKEILSRPDVRPVVAADFAESFRQGSRAAAWEFRLYLRRWDFDLDAITLDVGLWQGEVDTLVPASMGRYFAQAIASSHARFFPDEGHYLIVDRMEEVEAALFGAAR